MLCRTVPFAADVDLEYFAQFPASRAIFVLRQGEAQPYVGKTSNLKKRLARLLSLPEEGSKTLNLRQRVSAIEYSATGSDFESGLALYKTLKSVFGGEYRKRIRLQFAPFIRINWENPYPRAFVTRRLSSWRSLGEAAGEAEQARSATGEIIQSDGQRHSVFLGPFPSQSVAEKFLNGVLDLFKSRRCTFNLNPDPQFPGCVYSEMKMCLAPCFQGCTDEEYFSEVNRVQQFFETAGESVKAALAAERESASARMDFEAAAAIHSRMEKVAALKQPEIVRSLDHLDGIIIQPSAEPGCVSLFRLRQGMLSGPVDVSPNRLRAEQKTIESRIRESVANLPPPAPVSVLERMEHIAIVKRWYYRSHRVGEIFLADKNGELPWRRIARGASRVLNKEKLDPENENNLPAISS